MNAVLIPVRSTTGAKNRLAADFDEDARTRLTLAMLADMVRATAGARSVDAVYVVSADATLLEHARRFGARTLSEPPRPAATAPTRPSAHDGNEVRGGLNRAVFHGARTLAEHGVTSLLAIPGDVPLVAAREVDELFAAAASAAVVVVPSASGSGTNGLLLTPPTAITPQFEGESLAAHIRACRAAALVHTVHPAQGFALDIDTLADLRVLARSGADRESVRVAASLLAREHDATSADSPATACAAGSRG